MTARFHPLDAKTRKKLGKASIKKNEMTFIGLGYRVVKVQQSGR